MPIKKSRSRNHRGRATQYLRFEQPKFTNLFRWDDATHKITIDVLTRPDTALTSLPALHALAKI